jgi:DNA-binding Lrp family transcriptional regulator
MLDLANSWQRGFPLTARPFAEIGERCAIPEAEVLEKFRDLVTQGIIDRIGPVFRPNTVGASLLAAMAVPPERLAAVADFVNAQPGVNHNYERENRLNLWFVVTGAAAADVERALRAIEDGTGLDALRLPLLEEFHIDLGFDLDTHAAPRDEVRTPARSLSDEEKSLVRATVRGFPLVPAPYDEIAKHLGLGREQVIGMLQRLRDEGHIRRIGAVIRHRRIGYEANAMVVWDVPDPLVADLGSRVAKDASVSLCYRRARALPAWPYNLYCMLHGRDRTRVLFDVKRISAAYGLGRYPRSVLFSKRCFAQRAAGYG